jgi:hypothetical protein
MAGSRKSLKELLMICRKLDEHNGHHHYTHNREDNFAPQIEIPR